jgi:hypothetical protein
MGNNIESLVRLKVRIRYYFRLKDEKKSKLYYKRYKELGGKSTYFTITHTNDL